jgi:DNA segregation ATPase FtsK/SpoIIIE-like protein
LLLAASACFGLVKHPLHIGEAKIPMGGLIGSLLGGFFHSYLNTAGAALLTFCILIFAISLSTKISIRDMALYAWLGLSKGSVLFAGATVYAGMQCWSALQSAESAIRPVIKKFAAETKAYVVELLKKKPQAEIPTPTPGPKIVLAPEMPEPEMQSNVIALPMAVGAENTEHLSVVPDYSPEIITDKEKLTSDAELLFRKEMAAPESGEKPNGLMNFMRKAVTQNEHAVKSALGKKANYKLPPLSFLESPIVQDDDIDKEELQQKSQLIMEKLSEHKIPGHIEAVKYGPVVTMYEFKPGAGVKVNSIESRSDDLAMGLSAQSVRIVAPIPGRDVVGIEVPNRKRKSVLFKEIVGAETFQSKSHSIPIAIGKDIFGKPQTADLKKMPHLLVAGTTGSGKSVFINTLLASLLYRFNPDELNLILIDPKQIELTAYNDIPHLLLPVVTEPKKASLALGWAVHEMERRYRLIAKAGVRDLESFNQKVDKLGAESMSKLLNHDKESFDDVIPADKMPKLVIVIDELADLMMTAKADVENNICRIAQKARAAGMHLVLATQRPSTDVVTGLIKANLPSRICFKVSSKIDSRVIFETSGAEKLLGQGDMLYMPSGDSRLVRMHGAYLKDEEIDQITNFWKAQGKPNYRDDILVDPEEDTLGSNGAGNAEDINDPLYEQALEIAYSSGSVSASYLQRRLRIGYNKAARFVELMEAQGVVGPAEGSRPRPVLSPRL